MMRGIYEVGGKGHSCGIYSFDQDHIHRLALAAPVSRIMVRQPQSKANAGAFNNGMPMTSSLGCGTWGGNIVSENVHLKHYLNTTWVSVPIKEDKPSDEELFGEFYDAGARSRGESRRSRPECRSRPHRPSAQDRHDWTKTPEELLADASAWWDTAIIDIHPGKIAIRGYPIEELIGRVRFPDMIWLMLRGELPSRGQAELLEAALVPRRRSRPARAVDRDRAHGGDLRPAGQRRDGLGDQRARRRARRRRPAVHGALSRDRRRSRRGRRPRRRRATAMHRALIATHGEKIVPGFGHRFHPVDPRTAPLFALVAKARSGGRRRRAASRAIGRAVEAALQATQGRATSR